MKKIFNLQEDFVNEPNVAVIGDEIAYLLDNSDLFRPIDLIDPNIDVDLLLKQLTRQEPYPFVDTLFFSVGSNDLFDPNTSISALVNELSRVFPNAELYLMKGYIDIDEYDFDDEQWDKIGDDEIIFHQMLEKDKVNVVGNYFSFGDEVLSKGSKVIRNLRWVVDNFIHDGGFEFENEDQKEILQKNQNLNIDDETDYDTIYEFLDNFDLIVKSKNSYSIDDRFSDIDDVRIIKIALSFLGYGDLTENGFYDEETEKAVKKFQMDNTIQPTGISDNDTLEELIYELRVHGFDEDDLSKFLSKILKDVEPEDEFEMINRSVSDFKQEMSNIGVQLKGGGADIDSGGNVDPKFLGIVTSLFQEFKKMVPNANLVVTSGNDKFHHGLNYTSLHSMGKALDVTLDGGYHRQFIKLLNDYKGQYSGFGYIDEYNDPSDASTGPHFHLQYKG